jgi:hypothetical protein
MSYIFGGREASDIAFLTSDQRCLIIRQTVEVRRHKYHFAELRCRSDERRITSTRPLAIDPAVWPYQGLRGVPWKGYLVPLCGRTAGRIAHEKLTPETETHAAS